MSNSITPYSPDSMRYFQMVKDFKDVQKLIQGNNDLNGMTVTRQDQNTGQLTSMTLDKIASYAMQNFIVSASSSGNRAISEQILLDCVDAKKISREKAECVNGCDYAIRSLEKIKRNLEISASELDSLKGLVQEKKSAVESLKKGRIKQKKLENITAVEEKIQKIINELTRSLTSGPGKIFSTHASNLEECLSYTESLTDVSKALDCFEASAYADFKSSFVSNVAGRATCFTEILKMMNAFKSQKITPENARELSDAIIKSTAVLVECVHDAENELNELLKNQDASVQNVECLVFKYATTTNQIAWLGEIGDALDSHFCNTMPLYKGYTTQLTRIKKHLNSLATTTKKSESKEHALMEEYNDIILKAFNSRLDPRKLEEMSSFLNKNEHRYHFQLQHYFDALIPNIIRFEEKGKNALQKMKENLLKNYRETLKGVAPENREKFIAEQKRMAVQQFSKSIRYIMMLRDVELYLAAGNIPCDRSGNDHLIPEALASLLRLDGLEELFEEKSEPEDVLEEVDAWEGEISETLPKFDFIYSNTTAAAEEQLVEAGLLPPEEKTSKSFKFIDSKRKTIEAELKRQKFVLQPLKRGHGSHWIYMKGPYMITLPMYKDGHVPPGTKRSIERVVEKAKTVQKPAPKAAGKRKVKPKNKKR